MCLRDEVRAVPCDGRVTGPLYRQAPSPCTLSSSSSSSLSTSLNHFFLFKRFPSCFANFELLNGHFSKVGITQSQIQRNPTAWWSKHRNSYPWLVFSPGLPHSADFWAEFSPIFQPAPIRAMIRPGAMGLNQLLSWRPTKNGISLWGWVGAQSMWPDRF